MFPVPIYSDSLDKIAKSKNIIQHFKSVLTSVDKDNRTATFTEADGNLNTVNFDLLHIVPPQGPHKYLRESPLAHPKHGYADVDAHTLQHVKYDNVYALGDAAGIPASKTAAAVFA